MGVEIIGNALTKTGTIGNPFTGTEYFTNIDASVSITTADLTVGGGMNVQDDRIKFKDNGGGAPPALAKGDFWMDGTSGSDEFYFYGAGPAANMLAHSGTAFGGDVTGTIGANTVGKLQGRSVLNAAPNDGDVLTWDNANTRWAPIAPSGGGTYYTVLDSTATHGDINTALTNYDMVYLEPGAYANVTGGITIPANKQLIGLSGAGYHGASANVPIITLVTGIGTQVTMGRNSLVEGIRFVFGAGSASAFVACGTANYNARVRWCSFYGDSTGTAQRAIQGSFVEVSHTYIYRSFGISLNVAISSDGGGTPTFTNIKWVAHTTDTTSGNNGLNLGSNDYVCVSDCLFEGGYNGLTASSGRTGLIISNVTCLNQVLGAAPTGITLSSLSNSVLSNILIRGNNTGAHVGLSLGTVNYTTINGVYIYDTSSYGLQVTTTQYSSYNDIYTYGCGNLQSKEGMYIAAPSNCHFGSLGSYGSGLSGIYMNPVNCVVSSIVANGNGVHGLSVGVGSNSTFGTVTANGNSSNGVNVVANCNGFHFVSGGTTDNTNYGFLAGNSGTTDYCRISAWYSFGNTAGQISLGTNWIDQASALPDPATKATNDLLQYTGSAWDAKGAAPGDRLGGTLYGSAVDLAGHLTLTADNTYDIGASGATRPRTGYFGTSVVIAGQTAMKATDSTGGDLSGTYPSTLTVAKIRGYTVESHAPVTGESLIYTGSQYSPGAVFGSLDKSVSYSGSTSGTISSTLSGKMFLVVIYGRWLGGGSGGAGIFKLTVNNVTTSSYRWQSHIAGNDNSNWIHEMGSYGQSRPTAYFGVGEVRNGWSDMNVQAEIWVKADSSYSDKVSINSRMSLTKLASDTDHGMDYENTGNLNSTAAVTRLDWAVDRGSFYGRMTVFTYA